MDNGMKLAVIIDAENISSKYIKTILDEASNYGNIIYKRIYGNWTTNQMANWKNVVLENAILPVQQYSNITGKNSSDFAMIIDAMDLLYSAKIEGFCIVSSDSDFTRLATRLRESEMYVIGMGELKTSKSFINACNKFLYLDVIYKNNSQPDKIVMKSSGTISAEEKSTLKSLETEHTENINKDSGADRSSIIRTIALLIEEFSDDDGWIFSGTLGAQVMKRFPDFDVRNFNFKKFVPFVESLDMFEVKRIPSTEDKRVKAVYIKNLK